MEICKVANDDVELEATRKDAFSWHPCHVTICSTGLGLIVRYKDDGFEEIIADKDGVLEWIRVRSSPLLGGDCSSVQQGDRVLATKDSNGKGVFYDALVEEAFRVRHMKRVYCKCTFRIKWIHQILDGEAPTLPASAIMKLARRNIDVHPTISAFFSMVENSKEVDAVPFSGPGDGMDWEMDINVLLERQIKEISQSSDVTGKKVRQKIVIGLEVDVAEQCHDKAADAPLKDLPIRPSAVTGNISLLNPFAARAALASLRSSKFSTECRSEGGLSALSCEFSLTMSATLKGKDPKYEGIVKTLFSDASQIAKLSNEPSKAQAVGMVKRNHNSGKKMIHLSETRVTRAQIKRNSTTHGSAQITDTKEVQLRDSSKTKRVTRSTINGAENVEVEQCLSNRATEENMSTKFAKVESDSKMNTPSGIGKSFTGEDGLASKGEDSCLQEADNLNLSKRVTRSAALEKNNFLPEPKLRKRKSCESSGSKSEDSSELKKSVCPLSAARTSSRCIEESKKKGPNAPEAVVNGSKGMETKQASNSKAQERRSSSRLNLRPKMRSQTRA